MISIDAEFPTRREADDFARELEAAYPPNRFATSLNMQKVVRSKDGIETEWHRVYGSRQEQSTC